MGNHNGLRKPDLASKPFAAQKWAYVAEKKAVYVAQGHLPSDAAVMAEQAADLRCRLEAAGHDGNSNIAFAWSRGTAGRPMLAIAVVQGVGRLEAHYGLMAVPRALPRESGARQ